jgi:hydroxyacylglutathione hydrolase
VGYYLIRKTLISISQPSIRERLKMRLVDNLYAYVWQGNDNNCNSYLFADVLNDNRHLLVDPGHVTTPFYGEPGFDILIQHMERDGIKATEIGLVILTHCHPDHCEAARVIREQNGALVALHKADEPMYKSMGGKADIYLEEGELLLGHQGSLKLDVFHSPGHSPGHITIYWPEQKVLITGDVIFYHSVGKVSLPGGSAKALKQSIERLAKLDSEYLLCGHPYGHSGVIKGRSAVRENFEFVRKNLFR